MDKTLSINLGGQNFIIEVEAHHKLQAYLEAIRQHCGDGVDPDEVMADIESGLAEKLKPILNDYKEVITIKDIEELIKIMGTVEDFDREVGGSNDSQSTTADATTKTKRKLYRDSDNAIISGVSAGLGAYFDIDPVVFRLLFVALIFANGFGLLAYIIFWLAMPEAKTVSQRLEMRGQTTTLAALEKLSKLGKNLKDNGRKHWRQLPALGKIFHLPFLIIGRLWGVARQIIGRLWPIVRFVFGLLLVGGSLVSIMAIGTGSLYVLLQTNSDYRISFIPIIDLIQTIPSTLMIISGFLAIVIPIILLLLAGITIMRRRNLLTFTVGAILIATWMVASIAGCALALRYVPELKNKIDNHAATQTTSINLDTSKISKLSLDGRINLTIVPGKQKIASLSGRSVDLADIDIQQDSNQLTLTAKNQPTKKCLNCHHKPVQLTIVSDKLTDLTVVNDTTIDWSAEADALNLSLVGQDNKVILDGSVKQLTVMNSSTSSDNFLEATKLKTELAKLDLIAPALFIFGPVDQIETTQSTAATIFHLDSTELVGDFSRYQLINYQPLDQAEFEQRQATANQLETDQFDLKKPAIIGDNSRAFLIKRNQLSDSTFNDLVSELATALDLSSW